MNPLRRTNLFTANNFYGSDSDGTAPGTSQVFTGEGYPMLIILKNLDGAEVAFEYREVQEHQNAPPAWIAIKRTTRTSQHITQELLSGFEYRFRIITASGKVQAFIDSMSDGHAQINGTYEQTHWPEYRHHHDSLSGFIQ